MNCILTTHSGAASLPRAACAVEIGPDGKEVPAPLPTERFAHGSQTEEAPSRASILAMQAHQAVHQNRGWLAAGATAAGVVATVVTGDPIFALLGAATGVGFSQM
ncbi:hypothetical protein DYH09_34530 [bacterium CPR1]|nr:hypothetical protein [bacterium CPR1]